MSATVWDIPGWNSPLYPAQMGKRPGVGYFGLATGTARGLVCDMDGNLYLHRFAELKPRADCHRCWMVQVSPCEKGLAVYVSPAARANIIICEQIYPLELLGKRSEDYLPVAKVLAEPVGSPVDWGLT